MALVTNDKPVMDGDRKILDAGSKIDDAHPIVQAHPDVFRPLGLAVDEGTGRTSAVAAQPDLLHPDAGDNDARSGGGDDPVSTPMGGPTPHRVRDTTATNPPATPATRPAQPSESKTAGK